jgi:tetrahydromethanopterin S-methyltransferase subunit C
MSKFGEFIHNNMEVLGASVASISSVISIKELETHVIYSLLSAIIGGVVGHILKNILPKIKIPYVTKSYRNKKPTKKQ